jgi:hypothetical protein
MIVIWKWKMPCGRDVRPLLVVGGIKELYIP